MHLEVQLGQWLVVPAGPAACVSNGQWPALCCIWLLQNVVPATFHTVSRKSTSLHAVHRMPAKFSRACSYAYDEMLKFLAKRQCMCWHVDPASTIALAVEQL